MELEHVIFLLLVFMQNNLHIESNFTTKRLPNVVLIAANQFGLENFASYTDEIKHIRSLAQDAINFSHVYSHLYPTSSRAALLTGRLPVKSGMLKGRFLPFTSLPSLGCSGGMPQSEDTLAEFLERQGYLNKFIGLWDLGFGKDGRFLPLAQGFQSWFGILTLHTESCGSVVTRGHSRTSAKHFYDEVAVFLCLLLTVIFGTISLLYFRYLKLKHILYCFTLASILYATSQSFHGISYIKLRSCVLFQDNTILAQPYDLENLTVRFTEEAVHFIKQTALTQLPFFLTVNHVGFSKPLFNSRVFTSGKDDMFLDSLLELDWSVGSILRTIDDINITDNTVVIFTALSGLNHATGKTPAHQKTKGEQDNWESHIKVPLFIKWIKKWTSGLTINKTVSLMDIMPTILDLTSQSYSNQTLDGKSLLPIIDSTNSSELLHEFFFHYLDVTRPSAVTHGNYKAFFSTNTDGSTVHHDPALLYDLNEDPDELSPLPADEYQQVIATISEAVDKHLENRTRKWISQFEHPILPWLFPCADFPYCYKTDNYKTKLESFLLNLSRNG